MLIVCNGAFKSGSSWLHALVSEILKARGLVMAKIPPGYNTGKSPVSLISEQLLLRFIETEDIENNNYLTKAHFFQESTLARHYPADVHFIFVERDLRDAIVSHYHHFRAMTSNAIGFSLYYWLIGRYKAYEIRLFNYRCRKYFGSSNFFSYEQMKADTVAVVARLCEILQVGPLKPDQVAAVVSETSLDKMRSRAEEGSLIYYHDAGGRHAEMFRKGAIGEHRQYFGERSMRDIDAITRLEFSLLGRLVYKILFTWRRAALEPWLAELQMFLREFK